MDKIVVGCKLLRKDYSSLRKEGRVTYTREWQRIPGNGAYVAVSGNLTLGGIGPVLVYLECSGNIIPQGNGVVCASLVRIVDDCPERIEPRLRGEIAYYVPNLTAEQRFSLAEASTAEMRGEVALNAVDLNGNQRFELAKRSTVEWCREVAIHGLGLSAEQRVELALLSTPCSCGEVACHVDGLSTEQRIQLAHASNQHWRGEVACHAPGLTIEQRRELIQYSTAAWQERLAMLEKYEGLG